MGCYQIKTELRNASSHSYFHFLVNDFLHGNRSLVWEMAQNCATTSVKLSTDENSYLKVRRKMVCHSSS